jgi:hypothetical protein
MSLSSWSLAMARVFSAGALSLAGVEPMSPAWDCVPVAGVGLRGEAVGVDRGAHGPGVLIEGEVAVDDADLVLVAVGDGGEHGGVHARAVGTLEVVEYDDEDGGCRGAAAPGTAVGGDEVAGVAGDVELGELREGLAVGRDEEVDGMRGAAFHAGEGHGDLIVAGERALGARTYGDERAGRQRGLLAQQDFDAAGELGGELFAGLRGGDRGLRVATESGGEEESGEGLEKGRHDSLIISEWFG